MYRRMEKQTADDILLIKIQRLGLENNPTAKRLLKELKKPNVTSDLLGSIADMLGFVALKTQRDIVDYIKTMPSYPRPPANPPRNQGWGHSERTTNFWQGFAEAILNAAENSAAADPLSCAGATSQRAQESQMLRCQVHQQFGKACQRSATYDRSPTG